MIAPIRRALARRALRRRLEGFDRRIAEARAAHKPVAHLLNLKKRFVHDALKGGAR